MNAVVAIVVLALTCTPAGPQREPTPAAAKKKEAGTVTLRLQVPSNVARHAKARARGDAASPTPVLVLRNLVVGAGEGFTLEVFGPGGERLAVSGLVGQRQAVPAQPVERMTLVVPLNDAGSRLLSERTEVTLTLRLRDNPDRPALDLERAYLQSDPADEG
jgi:hypothetical protein